MTQGLSSLGREEGNGGKPAIAMEGHQDPKREVSPRVERPRAEGILPIAKSTVVSWGFEWSLPGHGEAYADCGAWRSKGCLNVEGHVQEGLEEEMAGKVFVRRYKRTCMRAECPVCYESWAGKEAGKIARRLARARSSGWPIHVVVSPPVDDWCRLDYEDLRAKAYSVAKKSGFIGGSCIFHPFREEELMKEWHFSPHFHLIGYGWIQGTREGYERHGWIVKNVGLRKTVAGTALYQLSHAGIHEAHHTVTWFGALSYNKLRVPREVDPVERCPLCGEKLRPLWYFGAGDLPEEEGDFWLDPEGWEYKPVRWSGG